MDVELPDSDLTLRSDLLAAAYVRLLSSAQHITALCELESPGWRNKSGADGRSKNSGGLGMTMTNYAVSQGDGQHGSAIMIKY